MKQDLTALDGRLELRGPLGAGGAGEVHRAWDRTLERAVAVKFVRSREPADAERLTLEARLQARVHHPHVVQVFEVGSLGGRPCIVLQLVEGLPLDELAGSLPVAERVELVRQAALGLHAAHLQGLVHRDVKPGNVMVEQGEADRRALVSDFGLARDEAAAITRTGLPAGTVDFMSPEQLLGNEPIDFRADVYGLGATLYAVLAGAPPFRTGSRGGSRGPTPPEEVAQVLRRVLDEEPPPLRAVAPGVARELAVIAARAMEKEAGARYPSAEAFALDLARFQRGEPVLARRVTLPERAWKWSRRNRAAARAIAAGTLAALLGLGWASLTARRSALAALEAARLGALAERFESRFRAERLAPRHDLRPLRAAVRGEVEALRAAGAGGSGPASFALAKGLELTGDLDGARAAYQRAWALGDRGPAVAEGLGSVLARLYHRAARNVSETLTSEARERQLGPLQREFRDPALRFLAMGERGGWRGPYLRGEMALLEQRWGDARAAAVEAQAADPGRYEARVLEAEAWLREGRISLNRFQPEPALAALRRAIDGLTAAEAFGRSDPRVLELLSLGHSLAGLALQRAGKDPAGEAAEAERWAEEGSKVEPDEPAFLVARAKSLESRALRAVDSAPASALPLLAESDGLYRRASGADPTWAEPPGQLAYVRYVRAALLRQAGRPSREVLAAGLRAAAEAARRAPADDYPAFLTAVLRIEEAESLQADGLDATEALRRGIEAAEKLLASSEAGSAQGHDLLAKALLALAREDWLAGRDPRPTLARAWAQLEALIAGKGDGDVDGATTFVEGAARIAWARRALGDGAAEVVARGHAVARALLARSPGLGLAELLEGQLLAYEARVAADAGSDPRPAAARAARRISAARDFSAQPAARAELAALPLAEASWRVGRGLDPAAALALAERRARANRDRARPESLTALAEAALLRARWLRGRGAAAAAEARRGLSILRPLLERDRAAPELWVLAGRLAALAGDRERARRDLDRAAALNPLVRGGAAWRAAEADLGV